MHKDQSGTKNISPDGIAVIGIGCRFPGGASSPQKLWELLVARKDGIVDVPPDRWDIKRFYSPDRSRPSKMYVRKGGFLQEPIDQFDPLFFGISPREAIYMDPQQRLLLEVAWEALEDAGVVPHDLAGTRTGVYIGGFTLDSLLLQLSPLNRGGIHSHHQATAASMTMLAARISYTFDLRGPSMTIDTACSSSLVALHYACQDLWRGQCAMALVGGVNIMLRPEFPMVMCKGQFLAPDGYCKSFDERADGYARGEGAAVVALKPLAAALQDRDEIYAVVRGTGVNQDGRTDGITVPSATAQEALIRDVYTQAGIGLHHVRYVEAHGTGTPVGDPIEASVLGKTIGAARTAANPCVIGSVKANIGHLEAAAGVAGIIKACLCLNRRQIPPQAHLENPNPNIPFARWGLRLPQRLEQMPDGEGSAYVGVNSFGYGGTNAHAVLQEPPEPWPTATSAPTAPCPYVLPISARSENALKALAKSYLVWLSATGAPEMRDLCHSAALRRTHFEHRLAVTSTNVAEVMEQLQVYLDNESTEHVLTGTWSASTGRRPVFVFSGMGPQWWAMGQELLREEPVFRKIAENCDQLFQQVAGWSILAEMQTEAKLSRMHETAIAQPANFVLQVALAAMWQSWGVQPAAIIGHSVGEVAAAYVAGALDLEDAVRVIYHRSRLQQTLAGTGKMLAVGLSAEAASALLDGREETVDIAAINSEFAVTLSGDPETLTDIARELEGRNIFNRLLRVDIAYHSPQMERVTEELKACLEDLRPRPPAIPLYSTVTGERVSTESHHADYWCRNVRAPVLFAHAVNRLIEDGLTLFLELGPHPVLSGSVKECLMRRDVAGHVFASLQREQPELGTLSRVLGSLYTVGCSINWRQLYAQDGHYIRLPTYPWQRERYWSESETAAADRLGSDMVHPLLGVRLSVAGVVWESDLNPNYAPYLIDHVIDGATVFPAAAYIEAGLAIHRLTAESERAVLEDLEFSQAIVSSPSEEVRLQWHYDPKTQEYRAFSRTHRDGGDWVFHGGGRIMSGLPDASARVDLDSLKARFPLLTSAKEVYARLWSHGLHYGPSFQCIRRLGRISQEVLAQLELPTADSVDDVYQVHPALLDASFQSMIVAVKRNIDESPSPVYVPMSIQRIRYFSKPTRACWCHGVVTKQTNSVIEGDTLLCDDQGNVLITIQNLRCAVLESNKKTDERYQQWSYDLIWEKAAPVPVFADPARWLLFVDEGGVGMALAEHLYAHGASDVILVAKGPTYGRAAPNRFQIRRNNRDDMDTVLSHADIAKCRAVVYLWDLDCCPEDPAGAIIAADALGLIQSLVAAHPPETPRLYLVTRGVQQVRGEEPIIGLSQAPLVGLARVARSEHAELRCTLVDLDGKEGIEVSRRLAAELLANSDEDDVALRDSERYVHRLVQPSLAELEEGAAAYRPLSTENDAAFCLEVGVPGSTNALRFREIVRRAPGPGEVEIQIHAAGLNFKDVLKVMGMLPEKATEHTFHGRGLGMEAAGVITRVGESVSEYKVGDAIVASLRDSFSSHVTVRADSLFAVTQSEQLTAAEAATIPVAFLTAYYALHKVARLSANEKVLIHAGTGAVGLAAIQVARWLGADIYATAGSLEKREYLRGLGIRHVWNSRTLEFAEGVLSTTGGRGVDVVLNSLPGEAFLKSLSITAPFGRFVEIGKRDIVENARLPLLQFNRNLTFISIDLDQMMVERPELIRATLKEVWQRLQAGDFTALPSKIFPAAQVSDAFRYMAQSKHIGKIVVGMSDATGVVPLPLRSTRAPVKPDATYLVTGGFGGVGIELAKWLANSGARHMVLVGRHGAERSGAQQAVKDLTERGVSVMAAAVDVSNETSVTKLFAEIANTMPPLRGVFHAAALLDDGLLVNLDAERLLKVMAPKALGAWFLHQHTRALPLDFFVLFSSASAWMGNPGQGNYVAANAFLDALAQYRRQEGLPATSIGWGAFADVGMVARNEKTAEHLARLGLKAVPSSVAMEALSCILQWNPVQIAFMDMDWAKWRRFYSVAATSPRFSRLVAESEATAASATGTIRAALSAMPPERRLEWLASRVAEVVASTLHIPSEKIDLHNPLVRLGIDSLSGIELQTAISLKLGMQVSILEFMKGDDFLDVAGQLLKKMGFPAPASTALMEGGTHANRGESDRSHEAIPV